MPEALYSENTESAHVMGGEQEHTGKPYRCTNMFLKPCSLSCCGQHLTLQDRKSCAASGTQWQVPIFYVDTEHDIHVLELGHPL